MGQAPGKRPIIIIHGAPEWVVTFGDMMSLLLTFFILLFSVSEMKEPNKFYDLSQDFQGIIPTQRVILGYLLPRLDPNATGLMDQKEEKAGEAGSMGNRDSPASKTAGTGAHRLTAWDNIPLRVHGSIFFNHGQAHLTEAGRRELKELLTPDWADAPFKIILQGHTAPEEATSVEAQHLLAYKRALVVHIFLISHGVKESRIEIQSTADKFPPSPARSRGGQAGGGPARVDIIMSVQMMDSAPSE